ncbi:MAG TPA: hypothetical protein VGJ51_03050 [Candidatus Angelobacter sp.]
MYRLILHRHGSPANLNAYLPCPSAVCKVGTLRTFSPGATEYWKLPAGLT